MTTTWREGQLVELALAMKLTPQEAVLLPAVFDRMKKIGGMDDFALFNKFHYSPALRIHAASMIAEVAYKIEKDDPVLCSREEKGISVEEDQAYDNYYAEQMNDKI
tara:strand:- start:45 stop:362 length:318 start_codon:yes stop_codon:yes gene_type:complete